MSKTGNLVCVRSKTDGAKRDTYLLIDCFMDQISTIWIWEQFRRYATNQVSAKTLVIVSKTGRRNLDTYRLMRPDEFDIESIFVCFVSNSSVSQSAISGKTLVVVRKNQRKM